MYSEVGYNSEDVRFEVMVVKTETEFWVVTLQGAVEGYQCFGSPCCLHLHPEDGGSMDL
jgi:hypothetical protein